VSIALAYSAHNTTSNKPPGSQPPCLFSLPIDVMLLILSPLSRKHFAKQEADVELMFRFVVSSAGDWRKRIKHRAPLTVQKYKAGDSKLAKLRFKDSDTWATVARESQGEEGAVHA